jgi:hypothetical protein
VKSSQASGSSHGHASESPSRSRTPKDHASLGTHVDKAGWPSKHNNSVILSTICWS